MKERTCPAEMGFEVEYAAVVVTSELWWGCFGFSMLYDLMFCGEEWDLIIANNGAKSKRRDRVICCQFQNILFPVKPRVSSWVSSCWGFLWLLFQISSEHCRSTVGPCCIIYTFIHYLYFCT